jgi:hypothetical protein
MLNYSKEFLEKTIKLWQPYSPLPLSVENAQEIAENMANLFKLLIELDKKYGKEKANLQS